jgi:hypothetical protein
LANQSFFTPVGPCKWAKVFEPQDPLEAGKSREWSIQLTLDPQLHKTIDFLTQLDDLFKEINGKAKVARDGIPYKEEIDKETGEPTGLVIIKFKRKETSNKGNIIPPPLVIDSQRNPWPADTLIGNGSKARIKFSPYGWDAVTGTGRGLSLWLEALQVIDLVPYESRDMAEGFDDVEGGYVADTSTDGFERHDAPAAAPAPAAEAKPMTLAQKLAARAAQVEEEKAEDEIPF